MSGHDGFLLLLGSPKKEPSTSESLGAYLLEALGNRQLRTETLDVHRTLKRQDGPETLIDAVSRAGTLILAAPLYVDSLPSRVIRGMEILEEHRVRTGTPWGRQMTAIVNCGFPEALHTRTALDICRCFARKAGFEWLGGLGLGGGEAIAGRRLSELGGMVRNVRKSLDLTVEALSKERTIPEKAVTLMAKSLMPSWIYTIIGSMHWKRLAKGNGVKKRLNARPLLEESTGS
ncbi:MAG: hypothetical protein JW821_14555 [Deltaproteobacteria bacterium]|nr:hypothetical protein [Deltaproteobacteria bacterium]